MARSSARLRRCPHSWTTPRSSCAHTTATCEATTARRLTGWNRRRGNITGRVYSVTLTHDAFDPDGGVTAAAQSWVDMGGFHHLTQVGVGCRVVFNATTNKSTGAINSAMGTVVDVEIGEPPAHHVDPGDGSPWVAAVAVQLDSGRRVRVTRSVTKTTHRDGRAFTKRTFPLLLGYAMTAHRAQGATLTGTTILHVRKAFTPAIVYVMLSRATKRSNLYILGTLKPADFTPVADAAFLQDA